MDGIDLGAHDSHDSHDGPWQGELVVVMSVDRLMMCTQSTDTSWLFLSPDTFTVHVQAATGDGAPGSRHGNTASSQSWFISDDVLSASVCWCCLDFGNNWNLDSVCTIARLRFARLHFARHAAPPRRVWKTGRMAYKTSNNVKIINVNTILYLQYRIQHELSTIQAPTA